MTIPNDENTPQQPAGDPAGSDAAPPAPPIPPAAPAPDAAQTPVAPPAPPAAPAADLPPAPPAFPAYGAASSAAVAAPSGPPATVNIAFWLYVASALFSVIGGIISIVAIGSTRQQILDTLNSGNTDLQGLTAQQLADATIGAVVVWSVVTLIFWAIVFVLFAFFARRGANWARIVLTVLTALSLLNALTGYGLGALQVVASIVAVVLIWLRPSTDYFNAVKAAKAPRA